MLVMSPQFPQKPLFSSRLYENLMVIADPHRRGDISRKTPLFVRTLKHIDFKAMRQVCFGE